MVTRWCYMRQAADVESARLLANDARQPLRTADFSDEDIDRLADDFIAEDRGEETGAFIAWAHHVRRAAQAARGSSSPAELRLNLGAGPRGCATGGW